jgi:hypothetical protein
VWAVGHRTDGTSDRTLALQWTPSGWSVARTPVRGVSSDLYGLSVDARGRVVAVGSAVDAAGTMRTLVEVYRDQAWTVIGTPNPPGATQARLWDVSRVPGAPMWAVGDDDAGPVEQTLTMSC